MEQSSTPWRVFDAPQEGSTGSAAAPTGRATPAAAAPPGFAGVPNQLVAIGGVVGALLIAAIAIVFAISGSGGAAVDGPSVEGRASAGAEPTFAAGGEIVVDVTGAVVTPGVYHLAIGSRIGDAIEAAGGFGPRVDVNAVGAALNLAAQLSDGAQVHVPSRDEPAADLASDASDVGGGGGSGGLVNLNTATQAQLEELPGIGPVTAGKILESRQGSPFKAVDELRERGLVGEKTFEKLKPLVTVG